VPDAASAAAALSDQFGDEDAAVSAAWAMDDEEGEAMAEDVAEASSSGAVGGGGGGAASGSGGGGGGGNDAMSGDEDECDPLHFGELLDRAAAKAGAAHASELGVAAASVASRAALGSVVVPRAAELDADAIRHLPPAMQFEAPHRRPRATARARAPPPAPARRRRRHRRA